MLKAGFVTLIYFVLFSSQACGDSIPRKIDGAIESEEAAIEAFRFFAARVSQLSPCGEYEISVKRVANEWLVIETIANEEAGRTSWRLWQVSAISAELVNLTQYDWSINLEHCSNL